MLFEFFTHQNLVRIIANISSRQEELEETIRVMEYTAVAAKLKPVKIKRNPI